MSELLTAHALAARLGVPHAAVQQAVRTGRLERCRRGSRFDFALAVQEFNANRANVAQSPDGTMASARRRLLEAKAQEAEVRAARIAGEYVRAADAERTWTEYIKQASTQLEGLPSRAKQRDPTLTNAQLVMLQALVHEVRLELAGEREEGAA